MTNDYFMESNKIGAAIQYFRETYQISQSKLGKGLCSVATLSRIEAGERDADSFMLETLLERLGKTANQFELILTDIDYILYQSREDIKKQIEEKNYEGAHDLLIEYENTTASKGTVHMQFIVKCKALLNELNGGDVVTTIELLMESISYTVPDFKANKINDYYLSNNELSIIIEIVQRMLIAGMEDKAKEILIQVIEYLDEHKNLEEDGRLYTRASVLAGMIYIREQDMNRALEICNKGIEKNKGGRKMDYIGELYHIKAQAKEGLLKLNYEWSPAHKECLRLYLQAYYLYDICEDAAAAEKIKKHLKEEYRWADTDWGI